MKIDEKEREFIITLTDTERKQLLFSLPPYDYDGVMRNFKELLQGMNLI